MKITMAVDDMLAAFEEKECESGINNNERGFGSALKRLEKIAGRNHPGIRYSDGKVRNSSFDD